MVMSACADGAGGSDPTPSPPSGTESPAPGPSIPSPPGVPSPPAPPPPSVPTGATLTGEVVTGVEAGCLLLRTGTGDYLLLGEAADDLGAGQTVTVRGQIRPDLMTTCQQGTPFEVSEVIG